MRFEGDDLSQECRETMRATIGQTVYLKAFYVARLEERGNVAERNLVERLPHSKVERFFFSMIRGNKFERSSLIVSRSIYSFNNDRPPPTIMGIILIIISIIFPENRRSLINFYG